MAYKKTVSWKKATQGFTYALADAGRHLSWWAKELMSEATHDSLQKIDSEWGEQSQSVSKKGNAQKFGGDHDHPWFTGTLHDSVAAIISDQRRTVAIEYMPPRATAPQTYNGQTVFGQDWGVRAARNIERALHFVPGVKSTLVVGVPYAGKVDESVRHYDFIRSLSGQFANYVEEYFIGRAGEYWYNRTYVANTKKR